jgi:NMD protein affecting ribosome stability and mRNA decay
VNWREHVLSHADEYRYLGRITGAGKYPKHNTCARCGQPSERPLIASSRGWLCWHCCYADVPRQVRLTVRARRACPECGRGLLDERPGRTICARCSAERHPDGRVPHDELMKRHPIYGEAVERAKEHR